MPTAKRIAKTTRARRRRGGDLTPAELGWLTGEPQAKANKFDVIELEIPCEPRHFDRLDALLDRAEPLAIVSTERFVELRNYVAEQRAADRRQFPKRPEYTGERIYA